MLCCRQTRQTDPQRIHPMRTAHDQRVQLADLLRILVSIGLLSNSMAAATALTDLKFQ
jgi:hypothetical protein